MLNKTLSKVFTERTSLGSYLRKLEAIQERKDVSFDILCTRCELDYLSTVAVALRGITIIAGKGCLKSEHKKVVIVLISPFTHPDTIKQLYAMSLKQFQKWLVTVEE